MILVRWQETFYESEHVVVDDVFEEVDRVVGAETQGLEKVLDRNRSHQFLSTLLLAASTFDDHLVMGVLLNAVVLQRLEDCIHYTSVAYLLKLLGELVQLSVRTYESVNTLTHPKDNRGYTLDLLSRIRSMPNLKEHAQAWNQRD